MLDFRGTTARAFMTRLEGFLAGRFGSRFAFGFGVVPCNFFVGVVFRAVRFLTFDRAFFRDFNVPFMPAWAIDKAFLTLSRRFFMAMSHHGRTAHLTLALTNHTVQLAKRLHPPKRAPSLKIKTIIFLIYSKPLSAAS